MTGLEFVFDVACPWTHFAALEMAPFVGRAEVRWQPVLLQDLRRAAGTTGRVEPPARVAVARRDLDHWASFWGRPVVPSPAGDPRPVHRLLWNAPAAVRPRLCVAALEGIHGEGRVLDDEGWLRALAAEHRVPWPDPASADAGLRADAERVAARGAFGVPTFLGPDGVFFGQDRMGLLALACGRAVDLLRWAEPRGAGMAAPSPGPRRVEFFHDFASPFSYLASQRIEQVAARHGAEVTWTPMLLGGLFRDIGTPEVPLFEMPPAERELVRSDLERRAEALGIPFRFPRHFPLRSILLLRASLVEPRLTPSMYAAVWADDRRIDTPEALAEFVADAGYDPHEIARRVEAPEIKAQLRRNTDRARALGACGVPTFVVEAPARAPVTLWGVDRFVLLDAVLAGWWPGC